MAVVFTRPAFWVTLLLLGAGSFWLASRLHLRWWPAWVLRWGLICLALIGIFPVQDEPGMSMIPSREILIIDQSDSISAEAKSQIEAQSRAWLQAETNRGLVVFGTAPKVVVSPLAEWPRVSSTATDLLGAVNLGVELAGNAPGRLIVATDGVVTSSEIISRRIEELRRQGYTLDFISLAARDDQGDVYLGPVTAPANLWEGTPFEVLVPVQGQSKDSEIELTLAVNELDSGVKALPLGNGYYRFRIPPLPEGIATIKIEAQVAGDPYPENNVSYAAIQVYAAPKVLFVTTDAGEANRFLGSLRGAGIQVDVTIPSQLPRDMAQLRTYQVIFLHNFLAKELTQENMLTLQIFVKRLGGGVIFLGGRNSYTLGNYQRTLIEPMLPVHLEPPPRPERPPVTFLLMLDRSSSMNDPTGTSKRPIDLAREAAMRAIENLKGDDTLGVLTYATEVTWDIPLRQLGEGMALRQAMDVVSRVMPSGGTRIYAALEEALQVMQSLPASAGKGRNILLLSDGLSADGSPQEFQQLSAFALDQGITISTISLGGNADNELMEQIAKTARGRFYAVEDAQELPRIMLAESEATRSENTQTGETSLKPGEQVHPILSGMAPSRLPLLSNYIALKSKRSDGAEDVLVSSSHEDPILSVWQYGLGRVVAWMGDSGEEWTGTWPDVRDEGLFWSQVIRYALPNPALGPAQVDLQVDATSLMVQANIQDDLGEPVNLAEVRFSYSDAGGSVQQYRLAQVGPGSYRVQMPRPAMGVYRALVNYEPENKEATVLAVPFAVNAPLEWLPQNFNDGSGNLATWVEISAGQLLRNQDLLVTAEESGTLKEASQLESLWQLVVLALLIAWPLEIAIRRRWLPWRS